MLDQWPHRLPLGSRGLLAKPGPVFPFVHCSFNEGLLWGGLRIPHGGPPGPGLSLVSLGSDLRIPGLCSNWLVPTPSFPKLQVPRDKVFMVSKVFFHIQPIAAGLEGPPPWRGVGWYPGLDPLCSWTAHLLDPILLGLPTGWAKSWWQEHLGTTPDVARCGSTAWGATSPLLQQP